MKELREEVGRLKSDFEQKWSSQIKMVTSKKFLRTKNNFFHCSRLMQTIEVYLKCMIKWLCSLNGFVH